MYTRNLTLAIAVIFTLTLTAQAQEFGRVEGEFKADGKPVELTYAYVYTEDHP